MKANPGGQIDLRAVVGRDDLIAFLWETIENQSVVMTAERRIGKTTVLRKMEKEPADGWLPVFEDLEKHHSALDFSMGVYKTVQKFLSRRKRLARSTAGLIKDLGGTEIGGVLRLPEGKIAPWKDILERSIEDLIQENESKDERLLFLWDELPFMLASIRDNPRASNGEHTAMEILDVLRSLRITHPDLRMVFTGSIGLHHVIQSLREKRYSNEPTNDMLAVEVPPLDAATAAELAARLLAGESIVAENPDDTTATIASEADHFPFYIHHVVKALKSKPSPVGPGDAKAVVAAQLVHPNDPWELDHYRTRIPNYYGEENRPLVLAVLDELAAREVPASLNELIERMKAVAPIGDREETINLLDLMQRDHYLTKGIDGHYSFRFPLIRRWWKLKRGL